MAMMTGVNLTAELKGMDADLKQIERDLSAALNAAIRTELAEELKFRLEQHIDEDFYDKYTPKDYIRRDIDGGLIDMGKNLDFSFGDMSLEMYYHPDGSIDHLPPGYYPEPIHGDMLISRLERKHPPYNWVNVQLVIPPRPFFTNFVDEMIEGNKAEEAVIRGILRVDRTAEIVADGMIGRDGTEGYEVFTGPYTYGWVTIPRNGR